MRLNPKDPPGRVNRKARAFEAEIARLRLDGYTFEAIRSALSDAGIAVSLSTVQREAKRLKRGHVRPHASAPTLSTLAVAPPSPAAATPSFATDPRTSREIAAAFVSQRITNPLLRKSSP